MMEKLYATTSPRLEGKEAGIMKMMMDNNLMELP